MLSCLTSWFVQKSKHSNSWLAKESRNSNDWYFIFVVTCFILVIAYSFLNGTLHFYKLHTPFQLKMFHISHPKFWFFQKSRHFKLLIRIKIKAPEFYIFHFRNHIIIVYLVSAILFFISVNLHSSKTKVLIHVEIEAPISLHVSFFL